MREKIKAIKQKFRLSMNGVVSQSMRDHGVSYKVNFGFTLPLLKRIAEETGKDAELAQALWSEKTVRESMMIAPLLYPIDEFTAELADVWVADMPNTEVADMCCKYLFCYTPFALEKAAAWSQSHEPFITYTAFHTAIAWLIVHPDVTMNTHLETIIRQAIEKASAPNRSEIIASLNLLKQSVHNEELAQYILGTNHSLPETALNLLTEERELFLEFSRNDSH